ncbi:MAG: ribonuclease T2 [Pseudomonadota bacterium]
MSGGKRPADRGAITLMGAALMAAVAGLALFLGPDNGGDAITRAVERAQEREAQANAPQNAPEARQAQNTSVAPAPADAPFDYYVLALSWSPSFCEDRPDADQCGRGYRFVLHGLWPQFERGYPQDCATNANRRVPGRLLDEYSDLTVSRGLLAYQWRKHGSCSGLSAADYFATARSALRGAAIPASLQQASRDVQVDPRAVEAAFLSANPGLARDQITVTCRSGDLHEVRICLDKDLNPRRCGPDVIRDCSARSVDLPAP